MEAKVCKQCGELKPVGQFRKYYGGRTGTYRTCKICEKINARAKYLKRKESKTELESLELDKIYKLYDLQRAAGLQPPNSGTGRSIPIADSLDDMLSKYEGMVSASSGATGGYEQPVPAELQRWLNEPLTEEPDYYIDEVYEDLKAKYRPQVSIDTATMQPVYEDAYKEVLEWVLSRFYEYEESYWDKED